MVVTSIFLSISLFNQSYESFNYDTWWYISATRLNLISLLSLFNFSATDRKEGEQRHHEPRKNDIQASRFAEWPPGPAKLSPCLSIRLWASAIQSPRPTFWSWLNKNSAFTSTKNLFFEKSQHDKIVQNDTLTICIKKSILIEIKVFI